jgi:type IV secretory pathway VirB9-like protein/archaellum component FlaG (FlaF/FlaG flagellin family)
LKILVSITALLLLVLANLASGQTAVTTLALSPDRIGEIKTAQGITTMIRFPDPVQEIICGDLYDPATGKGTFVVQRSGATERPGNEVFIKPVASKGLSNMFVKTGDGKHTYSFDLTIVSTPQGAHRMVNVTDQAAAANPGGMNSSSANSASPQGSPQGSVDQHSTEPERPTADFERLKAEAEQQARQKAAEILRTAQQQADRKIAEADAKIAEAERLAPQRAEQEIERRLMQALMLGLREMRVTNTKVTTAKKAVITLDPRVLLLDDKAYLRYMIQNTGDKDFTFASLSLEVVDGKGAKPLTAEVNQSKAVNSLPPGEALTGVIVFDPKQIAAKQKLTLVVRGENSAELAHLTIQE